MLMLIGPVRFRVQPLNATEYTHSHGASHVEKPVIGGRPPLEWTGDETESWSIRAVLFPETFGGESALTVLALMRKTGLPQYMMRGDGTLMGWVVITSITEKSTYLDASGVGKVIEVDLGLRRSGAPSVAGYVQGISGLFGGLFA